MRTLFLSTALATALALSGAALAQTSSSPNATGTNGTSTKSPGTSGTMHQNSTHPSTTKSGAADTTGSTGMSTRSPSGSMAASGEMSAKDLIGTNVKNQQGETVGEIEDLLVTKDGNVSHAVLSVGGFLGVGDRRVEVPLDDMQIGSNGKQVTYNVTKDQLKQMPEYKKR